MALNDKILYKKRSKSWLKNKNVSFEKSEQKRGHSKKYCRTTQTSPRMRACPGKSGRMVTLARPYIVCMPNFNQLKQHFIQLRTIYILNTHLISGSKLFGFYFLISKTIMREKRSVSAFYTCVYFWSINFKTFKIST